MDLQVVQTVTKTIGSLALAYPYLKQLDVADIIDTGRFPPGMKSPMATPRIVGPTWPT